MGTISVIGGTIEGDFNISNNDNATSITILDTNVGDSCSFSITDNKIYIDGKPAHFVDKKTGQPIDLGNSYFFKDLNNLNNPDKPTMLKIGDEWIEVELVTDNKPEAKTSEDVQGAPNRNDAQKQAAKAIEEAQKQAADAQRKAADAQRKAAKAFEEAQREAEKAFEDAQREAEEAFEEALREGKDALKDARDYFQTSTTDDPPLTKQVYFTGYKTASEATNSSILNRIFRAISSLVRGENGKSGPEK